jgi:plastocyanin
MPVFLGVDQELGERPRLGVDVPIAAGETFNGESQAVEPGTYDFLCTIHPTMTGQVTVVA